MPEAVARAVSDVLAKGLPAGLSRSLVGVELGQHLQAGISCDLSDGHAPHEVLDALQASCPDALSYAVLLELLLVAILDELAVLAELPDSYLTRGPAEIPAPPPRRARRRC